MSPVARRNFIVVSPSEPTRVMGYYSISPGTIEFARVPPTNQETRRAVFRLGRLAVSPSVQRQSLGGDLLLAAGSRALAVAAQAIQYDCACQRRHRRRVDAAR